MATVAEIRAAGTSFAIRSTPVVEPLSPITTFDDRLERFGEHYDTAPDSHLYRFLLALCGDAGAGQLKRELLYPRLQQTLESTHFNDLDRLYGNPLGLSRLNEEIYHLDPHNEALTQDQWLDVWAKDALYRSRALTWMRAILHGTTPAGVALAAEAAIGYETDVYEQYRYIENAASDTPIELTNLGRTNSPNEFIIVPRAVAITPQEERRVSHLVSRLAPVDTIVSVHDGDHPRTAQQVTSVEATSSRFVIKRMVTGRQDIDWPSVDRSKGFWITLDENEAPTFAFMDKQESVTFLTITGVTASSEHIGQFNQQQKATFGHLRREDNDFLYSGSFAFASSFAPITLTSPWLFNG